MSQWSRRDVLRASGVTAAAVPMAALVTPSANAAPAPTPAASREELNAFGSSQVMFAIHDARRGEVSILHGEHEVVVRDPQLVARIVKATNSAKKAG